MKSLIQKGLTAGLVVLPALAMASDEAEFDQAFLHKGMGQAIDTEQFRFGNPIAKGEYVADIYVNGKYRTQTMVRFVDSPTEPIRGLCWSDELLTALEIKDEAVVIAPSGECVSALDATPNLSYRFDVGTHRLDVSVPQIYVQTRPKGYIPRSSWKDGVSSAFLRYNVHGYHQKNDLDTDTHHHFAGVQTGVNLGRWSLRQSGSMNFGEGSRYHHHEAYAQRDIDRVDGRLRLGDFFTQSPLLDNVALRGVSLGSDTRMLPHSQNGYAPIIRGHATSDSVVKIYQNDNLIHELSVVAGPFEIGDIYALSSTSGHLKVVIVGSDGTERVMMVPYANTTNMLRAGQLRYQLSAGVYRKNQHADDKPLFHGSVQYGVNNHLTMQAGMIAHDDYQSATLGGILGSSLGSLSFDVDAVKADPNDDVASKLHLGYHKYLTQSKTYINADAYHYFDKNYPSLSGTLERNIEQNTANVHSLAQDRQSLKQQYQLNISQDLGKSLGSVYVTGVLGKYDDGSRQSTYQVGYGNTYRRIQYRFGAGRTYNLSQKRSENSWFAHLTIPFDDYLKRPSTITAQHTHQGQNDYSQVSFGSTFGESHQHQYSVSVGKQDDNKAAISAHVSAGLPMVRVGLSASKQGDSQQVSYSASGAIVAHKHGVTLANNLSDTFAIVRAKGAKGTPIIGGNGNKIDRFGNGVVSYLSPYQINRVAIDANHLPDDVEIEATAKELIPRANTTHFVEFATQVGRLVLFDVDNVSLPPLAQAYDTDGNVIGQVVQDGRVLVRVANNAGQVKLAWSDGKCVIDYDIKDDSNELIIYQGQCR